MYIQKLKKINQKFEQVNDLSSQNFEEVIRNLKLEGKTNRATDLEGLLDTLNSEMDGVVQTLGKIVSFFDKNSKVQQ